MKNKKIDHFNINIIYKIYNSKYIKLLSVLKISICLSIPWNIVIHTYLLIIYIFLLLLFIIIS